MTPLLRFSLARSILVWFTGILLLQFFFHAAAPRALAAASPSIPIPPYRAGDTARVDIVTPFSLVILDKEKTADSKLKQAAQIPAVFRWLTNSTETIISRMHVRLAGERARFLEALAREYPSLPLAGSVTRTTPFRLFWTNYILLHTNSGVTKNLARAWATNGNERPILKRVEDRLVTAAGQYIRPDDLDDDSKLGHSIKLVASRDTSNPISLADAEKSTEILRRGELTALARARSDLSRDFASDEKPLAIFSALLLEPNCLPEPAITREWRHNKTRDIFHVQRYAAGDKIVRAGEVITPVAAAALDEIRVKLVASQAQHAKRPAWHFVAGISAAAALAILAAAWIAWGIRRRRAATMDLQVAARHGVEVDPMLREQIATRVTRLLGYTFIQRLLTDRSQSINAVAIVAQETQEIESRIENIQQQVQVRYAEYEIRIARLEQELAAAEEQNRDLIKAKIVLAKQELEAFQAEQAGNRRWN